MSKHKWESPISDEQIGFVPSCVICGAELGTSTKTCAEYMAKMTEDMAKFIAAPPIDWQKQAEIYRQETFRWKDELTKSEARAIKAEAELKEERAALGYIMLILETNDPMKAVAELRAERDELKALLGRVKEYSLEHKTDCETSIHGASELCTCNLSAIQAQIDRIIKP